MPQPEGPELARVRARRDDLRDRYLHTGAARPVTPARGIHHAAFICRDVEETIRFYQEFLGFPLVELVENRDYAGSSHFFFDVGGGNLLGFFDFPGHDHPAFGETIGGIQHLALSVDEASFARLKGVLDAAATTYLGPDRGVEDSIYIEDPNGLRVEFYCEEPGAFLGKRLVD
ncbi:VOC family protein [Yinghuangia sp. YIM S09857]|uniref:VOC family protein n=1 Tax=Yinghuangia sp. YIM S09857 TaxID=3436929 RepID=UPI003F533F20